MADTPTPTGTYTGRFEYNPDTHMHEDGNGNPVVSEDDGKTWRYASEDDLSHFDRYHERFAEMETTDYTLLKLAVKHGKDKAEEIMRAEHPHHFEVQPDDAHYEEGATNDKDEVTHTRTKSIPNSRSATVTGHTDAWKNNEQGVSE